MNIHTNGLIKYYSSDILSDLGVINGFFSRHGGVSPKPWDTLNVGGTVGDQAINVAENRKRMFGTLNIDISSVYDVWQIHSNEIIHANSSRSDRDTIQKADAIITNKPGLALFMRFADCVPVLLSDPIKRVIAIVHAGWRGTVNRILDNVISQMNKKYHSKRENIVACIGPSIGPERYEIGEDVVNEVRRKLPEIQNQILVPNNNLFHLDLWEANKQILLQNGVGFNNIEVSKICTADNGNDWFSHRSEKGLTGRFGAIIKLSVW